MAFATQFALSLELTKLIPLSLVGGAAQSAVLSLARQLRNSGSDIIIEADLAELFGRSRIAPQLESSFRAVVSQNHTTILTNEIVLAGEPGPTVIRGLRERPYFSTIVQVSLLTWVHDNNDLAQGLLEAIEKRQEHAPPGYRAPPGQQGIAGTLTACEEQTSAYDWSGHLNAVAAMLDVSLQETKVGLLVDILGGLLVMLPMVQTLPSDRMIHIEGRAEVCITVVWAHHVLGLTVLVKSLKGKEIRFGNGGEHLYIDASTWVSSITLYDCSGESKDTLFFIKPDLDQIPIETQFKTPVKGYGKLILLDSCKEFESAVAISQDLAAISLSISLIMHSKLTSTNGRYQLDKYSRAFDSYIVERARLLFDDLALDITAAARYNKSYRNRPLNSNLTPPASIEAVFKENNSKNYKITWNGLLNISQHLAIILLALAHVDNMRQCENLPLGSLDQVYPTEVFEQLEDWDGITPLTVEEDTWSEVLFKLVADHEPNSENRCLSLVSAHGWSIYMVSFNSTDPATLEPGVVKITNGVPYRNGVRKSGVVDGPSIGIGGRERVGVGGTEVTKIAGEGQLISPKNLLDVKRRKTIFGERGDYFVVSLSFVTHSDSAPPDTQDQFRRTGYRELHQALWLPTLTVGCSHSTKGSHTLSPGCTAISEFVEDESLRPPEQIILVMTANDDNARWRALLAAADLYQNRRRVGRHENILLRTKDCCLTCAVRYAAQQTGEWTIIL